MSKFISITSNKPSVGNNRLERQETNQFVILVTGDRYWNDFALIKRVLAEVVFGLKPEVRVILVHGGASGSDTMAGMSGNDFQWCVVTMNARWHLYGKAAGPIRNSEMLDFDPDVILAFHNDLSKSKGTSDMIKKAQAKGRHVLLYNSKGEKQVL